jgi:hypothetical protein
MYCTDSLLNLALGPRINRRDSVHAPKTTKNHFNPENSGFPVVPTVISDTRRPRHDFLSSRLPLGPAGFAGTKLHRGHHSSIFLGVFILNPLTRSLVSNVTGSLLKVGYIYPHQP